MQVLSYNGEKVILFCIIMLNFCCDYYEITFYKYIMYEWISKHLIFVGCLDILTTAHQMGLTIFEEEKDKQASTKVYAKEDFSVLNRFESKRSESLQS